MASGRTLIALYDSYVSTDHNVPIRVVIADDERFVCERVAEILSADPNISVVGFAHDGDEVLPAVHAHFPDVVLMDIRMERVDGLTATAELQRMTNPPKVIVLTAFDSEDYVHRAVEIGAEGLLLKTASRDDFASAVHAVYKGDPAFGPHAVRAMVTSVRERQSSSRRQAALAKLELLTERELDAVTVLAEQQPSNAVIARQLGIKESTVKSLLSSAMAKLNVENRSQLAMVVRTARQI